jgi:hypothetical protein
MKWDTYISVGKPTLQAFSQSLPLCGFFVVMVVQLLN